MRGIGRGLGSYTLGDQYTSPQRRLSQMLTQQGSKGGPSDSWQETLGRIAQQLSGAYIGMQDQKQQDAYLDTIGKTEPDSFRPPTDAEAMAAPGMRGLVAAASTGIAGDGQGQTVTSPLPDDQLMGRGDIPSIMEKIGRYNQNMGAPGASDDQTLQQGLDLQSKKFSQAMNQSREASNVLRQRDFKAELDQGMKDYQANDSNRITNEKKPQLDFMIENLQAMPNNTYAKRGLAQALIQRMDRDDANINYGRQVDLKQMPLTEEQLQQKQSLLKPAQPKTVNTAEGVFILNSDGTLGERLGSPHSQFGYNQPQAPATPPPSQVAGIPTSNAPWDGMHPKEQPKMQRDIYKESFKMLEKNRAELANSKTMGESLKRFKYLNSIQDTGSFADRITDFSFDDEKREMVKITNLLTPQMRQGMPGAASDRDVAMFRGATVGIDAPKEINDNVIAGMMARLENANNRQSFMEDYFSTNKHLDGAEGKWKEYLEANPIFDPNPAKEGQYALNKNRQGYKQYFSSGKKNRRSTDTPDTPAPPSGFIRD